MNSAKLLHKRFMGAFLALLVGLGFFALPIANAQSDPVSDPASGARVTPTRNEVTIDQGGEGTADITVTNVTGGRVRITPIIRDFQPGEDGAPILQKVEEKLPTSLKDYARVPEPFELNAGEERLVQVPVGMPEGAAPGVYYSIIVMQSTPLREDGSPDGQVAFTGSVGSILIVQVPGDVVEKMQLVSVLPARNTNENTANYSNLRTGTMFSVAPNQMVVTLRNTGNSLLKPFGRVVVTDMRGKEVYSYELNDADPRGNVFPNSDRRFINNIEGVGGFGKYKVVASVAYGNGGDPVAQEMSFWVVPVWAVVVIFVLVLAVVVLIAWLVRKFRNRR